MVDGVQNGSVEMAHTAPYYFYGKDPTFCLGCAVPFGMNTRQMNAWMYEGNGLKLMREFYAKYNIINLPGGNTGAQMGGWFRKEIKSVADMKGLKMRIGAASRARCSSRSAWCRRTSPAARSTRRSKRARWMRPSGSAPTTTRSWASTRSRQFYYYPGWWEGGPELDFFINQQGLGRPVGREQGHRRSGAPRTPTSTCRPSTTRRNPIALKQLVGAGTKLQPFTQDVMNAAFKAAQADLRRPEQQPTRKWKKIYADYSKFRADQNAWFRFTEGTFDRFMQQQKL